MDVRIHPRRLSGVVTPPPSKSLAHRLVIAAAMVVGLNRFPVSFCRITTGRIPPCSLPMTGLRSA